MKKFLLVTGCMVALFMMAPVLNVEVVYAAEITYSDNWKMDNSGNWKYYLSDSTMAKNAWVQDYGEWYLLDSDGNMRTGIFKSNGNKYYLLDTIRNTGTYGKLLKNGMVYNGVTLKCDTASAYEGALSQETINALRGIGLDFDSAPSVENTQHIKDGVVDGSSGGGTTENQTEKSLDDIFDDSDPYDGEGGSHGSGALDIVGQ